MFRFLLRRSLAGIVTLWIVSVVVFGIFAVIPSNPAMIYAGRLSNDPAVVAAINVKLGTDKPLPEQYASFLKGIVAGRDFPLGPSTTHCPAPCLGYSFEKDQPVLDLILTALPITATMAAGAAVLWLLAGVSIGVLSALRRGTLLDRVSMALALAGVSLPVYFTGLVLLSLFVYQWHVLPSINTTDPFGTPFDPVKTFQNFILPWISLAFLFAALYARLTRTNMLETMSEDYIRTARAKGLAERTVVTKHGMRAALTPIVTIFGLDLGGLLGGAILTEYTFGLQGIGKQALDAIAFIDYPLIMGTTLLAAFFIIVANIIVDVLYAVIDPRVRLT
jgi:peptide/nickel transport system permease protein